MPAPGPHAIVFSIHGPISHDDFPGLCGRVCALLSGSRSDVALCDVAGVLPDAVTVDALARLQLAARRTGCQMRLRNAGEELVELVEFMGLTDVLPDDELPGSARSRQERDASERQSGTGSG
jgi:ABC-type transporter Mla MlaB component